MEREIVMRTQGTTNVFAIDKTEAHTLRGIDVEVLSLFQVHTARNHRPADCTRTRCG